MHVATGLGRIDIQSEPEIKFEYVDMQEQIKQNYKL